MARRYKTTELTVQEWVEEINQGLQYRSQYGCEDSWNRMEALFYNVHSSQANSGPNIVMSTGDAFMSAMNVPNPYVTVKARQANSITSARLQESTDNMLIDDLEMKSEIGERAILSTFLFGRGIVKVGYDSEFGYSPRFDLGGDRNPVGMTMTQFSKFGQRIEFGGAESGMPWVSAVMPHDFVVPWGTYDIRQAPWCAHRVIRHIDEIKADPKYESRGLYPCMSMIDFVKSYESTAKTYRFGHAFHSALDGYKGTGNAEYVELWEIHDRRTGKIIVIATGHDSFLRNEIDLLQLEGGLPFVTMSFVPRTRNFWTTPDAYYLEQVQLELSDIAIQGQKHRRARVLKYLLEEGSMTPDEIENLLSSDVGMVALVKRQGEGAISNSVVPLQVQADIGLIQEANATYRNARQIIGLSPNQLGEYDTSSRRSATEASIVNNASTQRMDRRQAGLASAYINVFKIIHPILWKFWTVPKVTQIMGQEGVQEWVRFTGQHLKGDYSLSVGFSTGGNETLQSRRQNALQLWAMMSQNPFVDPTKLAQFLNLAYNDPEFSSIFKEGALNGQLQNQMQMMQQMQQQGASNGNSNQGQAGSNTNRLFGLGQG